MAETSENAQDVRFRMATVADAPRLLEIYRYYVEETAITFECTVPAPDEFADRMRRTLARYPYLVAEAGGEALGYAYAGPFVGREAYDWAVETTIYLDAAARRHGIGGRLYARLEAVLGAMGVLNLNACIGYPKAGAPDERLMRNSAQFHEHLGYRLVGTFHDCGYKFGRWYDMVWMEKMLGAHPDRPAPVTSWHELDPARLARLLGPERRESGRSPKAT